MKIIPKSAAAPGKYVSDLINDRYQILESPFYAGQYLIYDHESKRVIREKRGEFNQLFNKVEDAYHFIGATPKD